MFDSADTIFRHGKVSFGGVHQEVNLSMVPEAAEGDYVLVHVGVAISKIDEDEAQKTFEYLEQIGEVGELTPERDVEHWQTGSGPTPSLREGKPKDSSNLKLWGAL